MDEVTGPIIAVALVLCAVFVPCAFISGITGQFFRQFAVTIAVSTVISAINALTMTPSRAVLIFKTEEGSTAHELKREALPWWIFARAGRAADRLAAGRSTWPGDLSLPALRRGRARPTMLGGCHWASLLAISSRRGGRRRWSAGSSSGP